MLCSSCGDLVKPIVACDIDGTLGQYHRHFLVFAGQYFNKPGLADFANGWSKDPLKRPLYYGDVDFRVWFCARFGVDESQFRQCKLAYRQGGLKRSMPRYGDADTVTRAWRAAGAEVWLTTTRPYLRLDGVDPDTREWLLRNEIEYDGLLYDEDKYHVLAQRVDPVRVVAVVDDLGEQIRAAEKVFGMRVPIQRLNGYNDKDRAGSIHEETLPRISEIVLERIAGWKEAHSRDHHH